MKKFTILLILAFMVMGFNGWTQVFITELADPENAAGARYVELYNAGSTAIDLNTGWQLQRETNDNGYWQSPVNLTGIIPAGGFYTVCANQTTYTSTYGFAANQNIGTGGPADSNGDDKIRLLSPGSVVEDMFGVFGVDGSGTNHEFEDGRAERKATVTTGNTTYTFAEWNIWNDTGAAGTTNDPQQAPDDFDPGAWIGASAGPILTVSPLTLSGFTYELGSGPSTQQTFTVEGVDLTADITVTPSTNYEISLDNSTYQLTAITLTQTGGVVATTTIYTRLQATLAAGGYVEDIVISSTDASDKIVTCTGAVETPVMTTLSYAEPFDLDLGDCYVYSVSGPLESWVYGSFGGNGYADMNGFGTGDTEEDWLILPGINFDDYSNERMTFDTWYQFGIDDPDNYLKLFWSDDYYGIGDPSSFDWTEISYTQPGTANAWESSGTLDLSGIAGTNVYIALKYNYQPGDYRWWQVDNIAIYEAAYVDVTFQVNMEEQTVSPNGVHVAGTFNGWVADATEMLDGDADGTYDVTLSLISGLQYEFKYINGDAWGTNGVAQEIVPAECQASGSDNRFEIIGETDYTIDPVCYGSCNDCGTPTYDITFQVDMQNEFVTGDVYVAGGFTGWADQLMTNIGGTVYEFTIVLEEGSYHEFKFKNGPGGWENFEDDGGCLIADWDNRFYTVPSGNATYGPVCFNSCNACPVADFVMINEVDADTPGTDTQEFIELYDGGVGNTSLSGLVVVLYNGSDSASYLPAIDLDGESTNASGYYVLGSALVPNVDTVIGVSNIIQNGADAVALYIGDATDFPEDTPVTEANLIDAIVYGTNDADAVMLLDTLTPGELQVNESGRGNSAYHSNQRIPNGSGGLRMTGTYDQSAPTSGAVNLPISYNWTGDMSNDWFDFLNWSGYVVPTATDNVFIGSGMPNDPEITGTEAECADLEVNGTTVTIQATGGLNASGTVLSEAGDLMMYSDASGNSSSFRDGGIDPLSTGFFTYVRTIEPYDDANDHLGWHYIASPIEGFDNWDMFNYWINTWNEPALGDPDFPWIHMEGSGDCIPAPQTSIGVMEGWSVRQDYDYACGGTNPGTGDEIIFNGLVIELHSGNYDRNYTASGGHTAVGYNLMGNPYPSYINMDAFAGMNVHIWDGSADTYLNWADGGDFTEIPPTQGFFVYEEVATVPQAGNVALTNANRVFGTQSFQKSTSNQVVLRATGNDKEDKTYIRFSENATAGYDNSGIDAYKLMGTGTAPQIYTVTNGIDFSINTLAETPIVPMSFFAAQSAAYTIEAIETGEFATVVLEDRFYGVQTDLLTNSYTFNYTVNDDAERFFIHFTPLGAPEISASSINLWSNDHKIYVQAPDITGDIVVFNMMGQEVTRTQIESGLNVIPVVGANAYYVVKIIGSEVSKTGKVYVK